MIAPYIPRKGHLFYLSTKPREITVQKPGSTGTTTVERYKVGEDHSYSNAIFRCEASDQTVVVGKVVVPLNYPDQHQGFLFRINHYLFQPVGPEVARHYQLEVNHD